MVLHWNRLDYLVRAGTELLPQVDKFRYVGLWFVSTSLLWWGKRDLCSNLTCGYKLWVISERMKSQIHVLPKWAGHTLRNGLRSSVSGTRTQSAAARVKTASQSGLSIWSGCLPDTFRGRCLGHVLLEKGLREDPRRAGENTSVETPRQNFMVELKETGMTVMPTSSSKITAENGWMDASVNGKSKKPSVIVWCNPSVK